VPHASTSNMYLWPARGRMSIGGSVSRRFSSSKANSCTAVQGGTVTGAVEPMRSVRGVAIQAKFETNRRKTWHMPMKLRTWVRVVGKAASRRALEWACNTPKRPRVISWTRFSTVVRKKRHLSNLRVTPAARRSPSTSSKRCTCASGVLE